MINNLHEIKNYLDDLIPKPKCELIYNNNFELLIAIILSAQTTDKSVNKITGKLFSKYNNSIALGNANINDVEEIIKSIGLYHLKASRIIEVSKVITSLGSIPDNFNDLITINGIGRKTASVFLYEAFNKNYFAVDTHVFRVLNRLGINKKTPLDVERYVKDNIEEEFLGELSLHLVLFGRYYCKASAPSCLTCKLSSLCNYFSKNKIS